MPPPQQLVGQLTLVMRIGSHFFVMRITFKILVSVLFISMPKRENLHLFEEKCAKNADLLLSDRLYVSTSDKNRKTYAGIT